MLAYNKEYLIMGCKIINKRNGKSYELPKKLRKRMDSCLYENKFENLGKTFLDFLKEEKIVIEDEEAYYPFVVDSEEYRPMRLFIQLTGKCNLSCKHCFLGDSEVTKEHFSYDGITKIIDESVELGISRIDFTGGEISTVSYLPKLLGYLDNKPISYALFTNLAFVSNELMNKMINSKGLGAVITSIDYFNADKHDCFRGKKGVFEKTLNNALILHNNGVKVIVNTMILKDNHDDIREMIDYFIPKGIEMHFDTVVKKGNANKNIELFNGDVEDELNFVENCIEYLEKTYGINNTFFDISCGVGKTLLYLDKEGHFQLCPGLTETENKAFYLGDTIERAYQKLKFFDLKCCKKECEFYTKCTFGCREKALFNYGSVSAPDQGLCRLLKRRINSHE